MLRTRLSRPATRTSLRPGPGLPADDHDMGSQAIVRGPRERFRRCGRPARGSPVARLAVAVLDAHARPSAPVVVAGARRATAEIDATGEGDHIGSSGCGYDPTHPQDVDAGLPRSCPAPRGRHRGGRPLRGDESSSCRLGGANTGLPFPGLDLDLTQDPSRLPSLPRKAKLSRGSVATSVAPTKSRFVAKPGATSMAPACVVYRCVLRICDSTAATAVMLTTRRGEDAGVRMCAGWSRPIRIGPIATPPVITRTML